MDAATLQNHIYGGYAKAAQRIGYTVSQYRPTSAGNPITSGTLLRTFNASFNAEDMKYGKPNKYGHPTWFGLFDGRLTLPGDYLSNAQDGIFFIAAQQTALPILLVQCNRSIKITRENAASAVGAIGYSGNQPSNESDILGTTGALWPASVLLGGRGKMSELPAGVKNVGWQILLPPSVPITIIAGDIATDDLGKRYAMDSAELTDLGWRINAQEVHT